MFSQFQFFSKSLVLVVTLLIYKKNVFGHLCIVSEKLQTNIALVLVTKPNQIQRSNCVLHMNLQQQQKKSMVIPCICRGSADQKEATALPTLRSKSGCMLPCVYQC